MQFTAENAIQDFGGQPKQLSPAKPTHQPWGSALQTRLKLWSPHTRLRGVTGRVPFFIIIKAEPRWVTNPGVAQGFHLETSSIPVTNRSQTGHKWSQTLLKLRNCRHLWSHRPLIPWGLHAPACSSTRRAVKLSSRFGLTACSVRGASTHPLSPIGPRLRSCRRF